MERHHRLRRVGGGSRGGYMMPVMMGVCLFSVYTSYSMNKKTLKEVQHVKSDVKVCILVSSSKLIDPSNSRS